MLPWENRTDLVRKQQQPPPYGGIDADQIICAVPQRITTMLDGIPAAAAAGDQGMANLITLGEPQQSQLVLTDLLTRIPAIRRHLR